jgi:hypothetical protein
MHKKSRRRSDNVLSIAPADSATAPPAFLAANHVTEHEIALRAFELYCDRGHEDGHDLDDWLEAERELRGTAATNAA